MIIPLFNLIKTELINMETSSPETQTQVPKYEVIKESECSDYSSYPYVDGAVCVIVQNNTDRKIGILGVNVSFYDYSGNQIDNNTEYMENVEANSKVKFRVTTTKNFSTFKVISVDEYHRRF